MDNKTWGFSQVWNASLENQEVRAVQSRDHLWASELGKAPIDLWLKLKGEKPSNPPNARSLRKFEAGNVFEWIVSLILKRAGILQESQKWSSFQYPGLLKVTGKADFIAGGKVNSLGLDSEFHLMGLPDVFVRGATKIVEYLGKEFPDGLPQMPLEIKSASSFMFDVMEKAGTPSNNHKLQLFHYIKSNGFERGNIVYICKDDLRIMEFPVINGPAVEKEYKDAIEGISKYFLSNIRPPRERAIEFNPEIGKFQKNWNVAYSSYLTMLYGIQDQKEFDDKYVPTVGKWNRVVNRIKTGAKMTEKNLAIVEDIKKEGFNLDELLPKFSAEENAVEEEQ